MSDETVRLRIQLLGTPEVFGGGRSLALKQLKTRALVFYLAATGQPHTREHLATLLWGEASQSDAYHSLRSSLYQLRKAMQVHQAAEVLVSQGDALWLDQEKYWCDVTEFQRLVAMMNESSLTQAITLRKGSFLQGFSIPDAPMFEDWVWTESARLNHDCFEALRQLVTWAAKREAWATAIGYGTQMVQIDPLSEAAQQGLMNLYVKQGEIGLALRQYRQFERQLQQELGIQPAAETVAWHNDLLPQQRTVTPNVPVSGSLLWDNALPFVGRDDLLHELATLGEDVQAGHGTTVLIQGEGGIGKSRLMHEFTSQLVMGPRPWLILQGACSPFDDLLSHGPFIEALQNGSTDDLHDLLNESSSGVPDARGRFFWRVLQSIRSLSQNGPVLLFIEDLQWANSSTLNLFGFLALRLQHLPVMLVGTVQHAEAIPALQRLITLGRRRHELRLLSLSPLTQHSIVELLQASHANAEVVETLADWLNAKSAGNPFLLTEILAQLRTEKILKVEKDALSVDMTHWLRWRATFSLPETAHDLVGWRLANISMEARHLLDVLAVASQPVPESVLRSLPGLWNDAVPALVDDLSARGLVTEQPKSSALMLPHHLLRETLLHRLSNLRRRTIHRQLAEALEAQNVRDDDDQALHQIALHAVAGEDIERARRYGLQLLPELPHEYTGAETIEFVHHLHDLLAPSASPEEMIQIARALGMLHQSLGQVEAASQWHRQTLEWARKAQDPESQADAYFEMSELALISINYRSARQAAEQGLEIIKTINGDSPSISLGRGYRLLGAALAMEGRDLVAAEEYLQKAVAVHRQFKNQRDLCAVLFELGNVAAQRGQLQRALDFYEESARVAEAERIYYYLALARNNFAYHSLLLGRVAEAQKSVAQGLKVAEAYDLLAALLHLYSTKGEIYLHLHQWNEAETAFHNGLTLAEELGSLERQAGYRGGLALVARGQQDFVTAQRLLEEALVLIADQGYWHLHLRLQLWLAETLLDQAQLAEAEQLLDDVMQVARSQQRTLLIEQGERLRARLPSQR